MIRLCRRRIGIEHRKRLSGIRLRDHVRIERYPPEERHSHVLRRSFSTALAKHLNVLMAMGAFEPAHVLHDADNRHFAVFAEGDRFPRIQQRHFLRSRNDDGTAHIAQ
jgi:hypothetical protein